MQVRLPGLLVPKSEDCLYLNVFTPSVWSRCFLLTLTGHMPKLMCTDSDKISLSTTGEISKTDVEH